MGYAWQEAHSDALGQTMSLCTPPESRKCTSFIPYGPQKVLLSRGVQIWFTLHRWTLLGRDTLVLVSFGEQCGCCSGSHRDGCLGSYLFLLACFFGLQGLGYSRETAPQPAKRFPCAALPQVKNGGFKAFGLAAFSKVRQLQSLVRMLLKFMAYIPGLSIPAVSYPCAPQ